jgi:hypothetical protein
MKSQLIAMGFDTSMVIKALKRFPKPEQEVQRIEWILSGADGLLSRPCPKSKMLFNNS